MSYSSAFRGQRIVTGAGLNLIAGLCWLFVALRNFNWFAFLDVYRMQAYRGHPRGFEAFLPFAVASLLLISAALGFLNWKRRRNGESEPAVTMLFRPETQ